MRSRKLCKIHLALHCSCCPDWYRCWGFQDRDREGLKEASTLTLATLKFMHRYTGYNFKNSLAQTLTISQGTQLAFVSGLWGDSM